VEFSTRSFAEVIVARPEGRIDHAAAAPLETQLMPLLQQAGTGQGALLLDLSGVEYISSVGLRVLMIAAKSMRSHDRPIAVAALQPVVAEIFAISRFDKVIAVFPSIRSALETMSAAALAAFDAAAAPGAA
jgi:anti-anti-sigma factor